MRAIVNGVRQLLDTHKFGVDSFTWHSKLVVSIPYASHRGHYMMVKIESFDVVGKTADELVTEIKVKQASLDQEYRAAA